MAMSEPLLPYLHRDAETIHQYGIGMAERMKPMEYAHFWSMPTTKRQTSTLPKYDAAPSQWVFKGARNGAYHMVIRKGPQPNRFNEMVQVLAKDLARLPDAATPRAF